MNLIYEEYIFIQKQIENINTNLSFTLIINICKSISNAKIKYKNEMHHILQH